MDDKQQEGYLHYNDQGEPICLSGKRRNNKGNREGFLQEMLRRYRESLNWDYRHTRN